MYADHLNNRLDGLAYHYSRSANVRKGVEYLHLAARECAMLTAHIQALAYLDRGLELLQSLPEGPERARRELVFQVARGWSLYATQSPGASETGRAFSRARELCARFGDDTQLFSVLLGLRLFHQFRLELKTARQLADQLVTLAEQLNEPARLAVAHGVLGQLLNYMGEFVAAREHLELVKSLIGSVEGGLLLEGGDFDQMAASLSLLAFELAVLGFSDQADTASQEALAWAQSLSRPFPLAIALVFIGLLDQLRRDVHAADDHSARALGICAEYGFSSVFSSATIIQGWVRSCRGEVESGIDEMRRAIAGREAIGSRITDVVPLVETYLRTGRTDEAGSLLATAIETAHQTGQRWHEAELYLLKGELLRKHRCNEAEAETCFRQAIDIAQRQSAKWWELRSTVSLARLLDKQGKRDEARAMLAQIYGWFTEGFDTADLKDAKALLEELSTV